MRNGKAKAMRRDLASFEETQETLALLKVLALGKLDVEPSRVKPVAAVAASSVAASMGPRSILACVFAASRGYRLPYGAPSDNR